MTAGTAEPSTDPAQGQPDPSSEPNDPAQGQPEPQNEPADTTDWKAEARKHEQRHKESQRQLRELQGQQRASMTEAERAVAEAEERGRREATQRFGVQLAQTEFARLAAVRNPGFDAAARLDFIDQSKFVTEDGEIDKKVIAKAVEAFVPEPEKSGSPSFDGGARSQSKATNMNDVIRGLVR